MSDHSPALDSFDHPHIVWQQRHTAGRVSSVAYSPNGERIVSGSDDGTVRVWDAETGQELARLSGHTRIM